jgi:hypothetical protein
MPFLVLALWTSNAHAQEPDTVKHDGFGARGQLVLDDLLGLRLTTSSTLGTVFTYGGLFGFTRQRGETGATSGETTRFWIAPSVDWFVADRLSIGGLAQYDRSWQKTDATTPGGSWEMSSHGFTVEPRVGYVIPMGGAIALWPRVGFGYGYSESNIVGAPAGMTSTMDRSTWQGHAELGVLFRLGAHGFLNLAPRVMYSWSSGKQGAEEMNLSSVALGAQARVGVVL